MKEIFIFCSISLGLSILLSCNSGEDNTSPDAEDETQLYKIKKSNFDTFKDFNQIDSSYVIKVPSVVVTDEPFFDPAFIGGLEAYTKFIKKNIKLPDKIINGEVSGTVYILVSINEDGRKTKTKIIEEIKNCKECTEEAIRLINMISDWQPGYEFDSINNKKYSISSSLVLGIEFGVSD
jgi:hypothetical protein